MFSSSFGTSGVLLLIPVVLLTAVILLQARKARGKGVNTDRRWYLETALKWIVTVLNVVPFFGTSSSAIAGGLWLLGIVTIVAVWSYPYRRKARIVATVGHLILILGWLYTSEPLGAIVLSSVPILSIATIWLTSRRQSPALEYAREQNLIAEELYAEAVRYEIEGQIEEAAVCYRMVLDKYSKSPFAQDAASCLNAINERTE